MMLAAADLTSFHGMQMRRTFGKPDCLSFEVVRGMTVIFFADFPSLVYDGCMRGKRRENVEPATGCLRATYA